MSDKKAEVKAGDPCPQCGGQFVVDPEQDPAKIVDRHSRNAPSPFVAARYKERVEEKADEFGIIHKCIACGYRSRFKLADEHGDRANGESTPAAETTNDKTPARRRA